MGRRISQRNNKHDFFSHFYSAQVYLVFRNGGKSLEDTLHNKSTAAKFISRSQPRTYASASSVNASIGHLHNGNETHLSLRPCLTFSLIRPCMNIGSDNRLNEGEAVEEIKQLTKQLQNLYDRIPQRGPATNVILTLLDICRSAQGQTSGGAPSLKPPTQPHEQAKKLSACNGSSCGASVDKETNTSFDNLSWQQHGLDGNCRFTISDKCDNDNELKVKRKSRSKCCQAVNNKTTTITCSSSSINFDNLQLQCMCSSDNNSLDEYQIENCDNCVADHLQVSPCKHHRVESHQNESFRERLLNFTGSNVHHDELQRGNNLRKRNSELVLGTNFDGAPGACGVYRCNQSYRISCDNIFSRRAPTTMSPLSERNNVKSNHSLTNECDIKTQIPYSFLERPSIKLSQSEDRNLRELKIALSSTLPSANKISNSNGNHNQLVSISKASQVITQQSQSCTSSSSTSSKADRISFSLSTSSTSEAVLASGKKPRQKQNSVPKIDKRVTRDGGDKQMTGDAAVSTVDDDVGNHPGDKKSDETITAAPPKIADDDGSPAPASNANNAAINNGNNSNGKKRKTPEGKLTIDLNDRSKYTEEVSV